MAHMSTLKLGLQGILMLHGTPELFPMFYHAQPKQNSPFTPVMFKRPSVALIQWDYMVKFDPRKMKALVLIRI